MAWLRNKKTGGWFEIPDDQLKRPTAAELKKLKESKSDAELHKLADKYKMLPSEVQDLAGLKDTDLYESSRQEEREYAKQFEKDVAAAQREIMADEAKRKTTNDYMNDKIREKGKPKYEKYDTVMIDQKNTPISLADEFEGAGGYQTEFKDGIEKILKSTKIKNTDKAKQLEKYLNDKARFIKRKGWKVEEPKAHEAKPKTEYHWMSNRTYEDTLLFKAKNPNLGYTIKFKGTNEAKKK